MTSRDRPADFETYVDRRTDAGRSVVIHLAGDPEAGPVTDALETVCGHLDTDLANAERIAVTDPGTGHEILATASPGSLLVLERRAEEIPDDAWGPLVTLFANARYHGSHVAVLTPQVPPLVGRGLNVRIELTDDGPRAALLEAAPDDPEHTEEIDLGPL